MQRVHPPSRLHPFLVRVAQQLLAAADEEGTIRRSRFHAVDHEGEPVQQFAKLSLRRRQLARDATFCRHVAHIHHDAAHLRVVQQVSAAAHQVHPMAVAVPGAEFGGLRNAGARQGATIGVPYAFDIVGMLVGGERIAAYYLGRGNPQHALHRLAGEEYLACQVDHQRVFRRAIGQRREPCPVERERTLPVWPQANTPPERYCNHENEGGRYRWERHRFGSTKRGPDAAIYGNAAPGDSRTGRRAT